MRLIDADKLKEELRVNGLGYQYYMLDNAPTVKAIPIEWIKKWCLEHYPTYPRIITEELLKKTETWRMIEDWEKENEID